MSFISRLYSEEPDNLYVIILPSNKLGLPRGIVDGVPEYGSDLACGPRIGGVDSNCCFSCEARMDIHKGETCYHAVNTSCKKLGSGNMVTFQCPCNQVKDPDA